MFLGKYKVEESEDKTIGCCLRYLMLEWLTPLPSVWHKTYAGRLLLSYNLLLHPNLSLRIQASTTMKKCYLNCAIVTPSLFLLSLH